MFYCTLKVSLRQFVLVCKVCKEVRKQYSEVGYYFEPSGYLCFMRQSERNRNTEDRGPIRLCTDNDYKKKKKLFQTHNSKLHFSHLSVDINNATVKHVSVCLVLYLDG